LKIIGITGSSGKTSTKDLLASILGRTHAIIAPTESLNNEIGVPATALLADEDTEILILEMGMRGIGHIEYLCNIAAPDISVVLNVGSAHLGELGSRDAIARAKSEIVRYARAGATLMTREWREWRSLRRDRSSGLVVAKVPRCA
jgi:UDP-N-acetylmuramoyl-tripeptide--D-alanyl-D-alanine ligase